MISCDSLGRFSKEKNWFFGKVLVEIFQSENDEGQNGQSHASFQKKESFDHIEKVDLIKKLFHFIPLEFIASTLSREKPRKGHEKSESWFTIEKREQEIPLHLFFQKDF